MGAIEDKIKAMGYTLPEPFKFPKPNRTGCVVVGSIIFASGHGRNMGGPGRQGQRQGRARSHHRGRLRHGARRRAVDAVEPQAGARRSRPHQARHAAVRHGQRGARLRPHAGGDRRRLGLLLRAVRARNSASMRAPRSAWPSCRTASRSRSTASSSSSRITSVLWTLKTNIADEVQVSLAYRACERHLGYSGSPSRRPMSRHHPFRPVRFRSPSRFRGWRLERQVIRQLAQIVSKEWSQPIVIDHRVDATGAIAGEYVIRQPAAADTLLNAAPTSHTALGRYAAIYLTIPWSISFPRPCWRWLPRRWWSIPRRSL